MKRLRLVTLLLAIAAGTPIACGGDSSSTTTPGMSTTQPTATAPKPTGRRGHAEEYRGVYADAKDVCGISTRTKVAEVVGSHSTRRRDIARTVANGYKPKLRKKAYAGCLAGLR
jgi:hypothetical protein